MSSNIVTDNVNNNDGNKNNKVENDADVLTFINPNFVEENDSNIEIHLDRIYFQQPKIEDSENARNSDDSYLSHTTSIKRFARNEDYVTENTDNEISSNYEDFDRESWSDKADFMFNSFGYIIGLGNFWRFPFYVVKYGGAFFIAYFLNFILFGVPCILLEMYIGQFTNRGPLLCWGQSALLRGIGLGAVVKTFIELQPYTMVSIRTLKYIGLSFNPGKYFFNETLRNAGISTFQIYFENDGFGIGQVTHDFANFGLPKYELVISGFLMWTILFLSLWISLKYSGKIIYATVVIPAFFLFLLLVHALSLKGAVKGVNKYLNEINFSKPEMWVDAAIQMMFSMGITSAGMNMLASFRKFRAELIGTAILICCVDFCASILCTLIVLSYLGNINTYSNYTIDNDNLSGYVLLFSIIPQTMLDNDSSLTALWLLLLFVTMLLLAYDSTIATYRVVVCGFIELIGSKIIEYTNYVYLGFSVLGFVFCIPMCCPGGYYFEILIGNGLIWCYLIMWLLLFIFVICFYGPLNICYDIEFMIKGSKVEKIWRKLKWYFMVCWYFCIPVILISVLIVKMTTYKSFNVPGKIVPRWMNFCEVFIALSVFLSIISYIIYNYIRSNGVTVKDKLKSLILTDINKPLWYPATQVEKTDIKNFKNNKSKGCIVNIKAWHIATIDD